MKIGIINWGSSNLFSITSAINYIGYDPIISNNLNILRKSDVLILPGVGSFKNAMENLVALNLVNFIQNFSNSSKKVIGICLGFQLLFDLSSEFGNTNGLGIVKGKVESLSKIKFYDEKIPNTGWKKTLINDNNNQSVFFNNFYYVHSFFPIPDKAEDIWMTSKFGDKIFCSAIRKKNIYGFQFHPEKSGLAGLNLLKKIIENEI